jgi:hypothetical protein
MLIFEASDQDLMFVDWLMVSPRQLFAISRINGARALGIFAGCLNGALK